MIRAEIVLLVVGIVTTVRLASSLPRLSQLTVQINSAWRDEYAVRVCGRLQAAKANLSDAAQIIASFAPSRDADLRRHTAMLIDRLFSHYPVSQDCLETVSKDLGVVLHHQGKTPEEALANWVAIFILNNDARGD